MSGFKVCKGHSLGTCEQHLAQQCKVLTLKTPACPGCWLPWSEGLTDCWVVHILQDLSMAVLGTPHEQGAFTWHTGTRMVQFSYWAVVVPSS